MKLATAALLIIGPVMGQERPAFLAPTEAEIRPFAVCAVRGAAQMADAAGAATGAETGHEAPEPAPALSAEDKKLVEEALQRTVPTACRLSDLWLRKWPWTMNRLKEFSLATRLLVTFVASVMLATALPGSLLRETRALVLWNVAILVFLARIVAMIIGKTPEQVRDRVRSDGHGRARVLCGVILAALSSLTAWR